MPVRCGTKEAIERFSKVITDCHDAQDSTGGTVTCVIRNVPAGWGEPCFDKLEALLAHAMLSIPATKVGRCGGGGGGGGGGGKNVARWRVLILLHTF